MGGNLKSEIRKNYFQNIYVLTDPNRNKRPYTPPTLGGAEPSCIFCPDTIEPDEVIVYQYPEANEPWKIISMLNRFSPLSPKNPNAKGSAEVLVETNKHGVQLNDLSVDEIVDVITSYQDRQRTLEQDSKYVHIFKNRGKMAGASRLHSHSQIYAFPFIPQILATERHDYDKYQSHNKSCPFCDIIAKESAEKIRTVWEDDNVYAVAPFASQFPYEVWITPKAHISKVTDLDVNSKKSLAAALKHIITKVEEMKIDYNYFLHSTPDGKDFHFHIHLTPRPNDAIWAGVEIGSGTYINAIMPEEAASVYRGETQIEQK